MTAQLDLLETPPTVPVAEAPIGNPTIAGLPGFTIGSVALALQNSGFLSAGAAAIIIPITLGASAISTLLAALWASRVGQNAVACIFATFTGFWVSYSLLVLGIIHNWFNLTPDDLAHGQAVFLMCWLAVVLCLMVGSLWLPKAFTITFILVNGMISLQIAAVLSGSETAARMSGVCALGFSLIGCYLLVSALIEAAGGKPWSAGKPFITA